jgi:hypothetical protein
MGIGEKDNQGNHYKLFHLNIIEQESAIYKHYH